MKSALKTTLVLLTLLLLGGCQASLFASLNLASSDDGVRHTSNLKYSDQHALRLDVYQPAQSDQPLPVLIFFYGGTWSTGSRDWYAWAARELARHDAIVIVPDYRQAPEHMFPDFMHDAAQVVDWAITHAAGYNGDPQRVFLSGHSAGAHIAVLLASDPRYLQQVDRSIADLSGVIGLAGPYDFLPIEGRRLRAVFGSDTETHQRSQPVRYVHAAQPPMLLLHGGDDSTVLPRNALNMGERLESVGVDVDVELLPGLGHVALLLALRGSDPHSVHDRIDAFIERHSASD